MTVQSLSAWPDMRYSSQCKLLLLKSVLTSFLAVWFYRLTVYSKCSEFFFTVLLQSILMFQNNKRTRTWQPAFITTVIQKWQKEQNTKFFKPKSDTIFYFHHSQVAFSECKHLQHNCNKDMSNVNKHYCHHIQFNYKL